MFLEPGRMFWARGGEWDWKELLGGTALVRTHQPMYLRDNLLWCYGGYGIETKPVLVLWCFEEDGARDKRVRVVTHSVNLLKGSAGIYSPIRLNDDHVLVPHATHTSAENGEPIWRFMILAIHERGCVETLEHPLTFAGIPTVGPGNTLWFVKHERRRFSVYRWRWEQCGSKIEHVRLFPGRELIAKTGQEGRFYFKLAFVAPTVLLAVHQGKRLTSSIYLDLATGASDMLETPRIPGKFLLGGGLTVLFVATGEQELEIECRDSRGVVVWRENKALPPLEGPFTPFPRILGEGYIGFRWGKQLYLKRLKPADQFLTGDLVSCAATSFLNTAEPTTRVPYGSTLDELLTHQRQKASLLWRL